MGRREDLAGSVFVGWRLIKVEQIDLTADSDHNLERSTHIRQEVFKLLSDKRLQILCGYVGRDS